MADAGSWHLVTLGVDAPAGEGGRVTLGGEEGARFVTLRKVHTSCGDAGLTRTVLQQCPLVLTS